MNMRAATAGLAIFAVGACGAGQTVQPASAPPPIAGSAAAAAPGAAPSPSAPFSASGTFQGTKFSFTCADAKSAAPGTDTLAVEGTGDGTVVSCHDLASGFTVTLTLVAPAAGKVAFTHSHVGSQIGFATPSWGTSSVTPTANPDLTITSWDTEHRAGTYKLAWDGGGSVEGSFAF